ncbi:hypothetical protein OURE66S_00002 [Oligella ureolytica]
MIAKPVIKWAGGKYRLSTKIIQESQSSLIGILLIDMLNPLWVGAACSLLSAINLNLRENHLRCESRAGEFVPGSLRESRVMSY